MKNLIILSIAFLMTAHTAQSQETVDLQWSICSSSLQNTLSLLQLNSHPDKVTSITYIETNPVSFAQKGVSFRTKESESSFESSVKVRFDSPSDKNTAGECSWDRYGLTESYTCEIKNNLNKKTDDLWSLEQKKFAESYVSVNWNQLVSFGPFANPKWKIQIAGYKGIFDTVTADGHELMELSIKLDKSEELDAYEKITRVLFKKGVPLCSIQEGKTIRYFKLKKQL